MSLFGDVARADRQSGLMPSDIRARPDADVLWTAFRRCHDLAWTGHDEREFVKGWDAARVASDEEER